MFNEADYHNIQAIVQHAYATNMVKNSDDAKVLLVLEGKCSQALHELQNPTPEVTDGDDLPTSD